MTMGTHLLVAGAIIAGTNITNSMQHGAAFLVGSVAPDLIDLAIPGIPHRRVTHAILLYAPLYALPFEPVVLWFALSCTLHILLDALTAVGVPVVPLGRHYRILRLHNGGPGEMAVRIAAVAALGLSVLTMMGVL